MTALTTPAHGSAGSSGTAGPADTQPAEALAVRGLTAGYTGTAPVVHDLDLSVAPGTLLGVLGPSGCGKTTLLRVVAGLLPAVSGQVEIAGAVMTDGPRGVRPEDRHIGLMPQDAALFPHLDVAKNVEFGLRSRGGRGPSRLERDARLDRAARREQVDTMLALVGLSDLAHRRPHELSGGQRQRVALARALAPQPALVLLDEPFSALDAALRVDLRAEVREILRRLGATAVLVTHDQEEAMSVSDHIAVLHDGRLVQADDPATLYARPADAWVAHFVGDCVLLPGTSDGTYARCELGSFPTTTAPGPVSVMLRPEQLTLEPAGAPTAPETVTPPVRGVVVGFDFFGHDTLYRVLLGTGTTILVRAPGPARFDGGDEVAVATDGQARVFAQAAR